VFVKKNNPAVAGQTLKIQHLVHTVFIMEGGTSGRSTIFHNENNVQEILVKRLVVIATPLDR